MPPRGSLQPHVRSKVAQDAWFQTGGGTHNGDAQQSNRRDRKAAKHELRAER